MGLNNFIRNIILEKAENVIKNYKPEAQNYPPKNGITNRKFAQTDETFNSACTSLKLQPTARQASKYRNHKGLAYKAR